MGHILECEIEFNSFQLCTLKQTLGQRLNRMTQKYLIQIKHPRPKALITTTKLFNDPDIFVNNPNQNVHGSSKIRVALLGISQPAQSLLVHVLPSQKEF